MRRSGFRRGLQAAIALAAVAVLASVILAVYSAVRANDAAAERANRLDPAATVTARLFANFIDQKSSLRGYLMAGGEDTELLRPYEQAERDIPVRTKRLRELMADFPDLLARVDELNVAYEQWRTQIAEKALAEASAGRLTEARELELSETSRRVFDEVRNRAVTLTDAIDDEQGRSAGRIEDSADLLLSSVAAVVAVLLALSLVMLSLSRRWLIVPINALRAAVNAVAAGRYDTTIPDVGPREIVDLAGNVEAMRAQLVSLVRQNDQYWEALAQEGPAVLALRDALTPSTLGDAVGLELRGRVDPAEGELAGDWFDAIEVPDGRVAVVVGDVAGHGAAPGVFALRIKQLLTAALSRGTGPAAAVEWVVEALGDTGETFATALVALVDPCGGEVVYANAGHPDALVLRAPRSTPAADGSPAPVGAAVEPAATVTTVAKKAGAARVDGPPSPRNGAVVAARAGGPAQPAAVTVDGAGAQAADEEPNAAAPAEGGPESVDGLEELASAPDGEVVVEQLISTGPLLSSIVAGPGVWRTGRLRLHAGDVLFVYTDGLVEARDADGRLFGQQRLVEELTRVAGRSPERLLADVFAAVRRYSPGRPSDDRTAIALSLARSDGERPPGGAAVDTTPAHPDGTDWRAPWQPPAEATH